MFEIIVIMYEWQYIKYNKSKNFDQWGECMKKYRNKITKRKTRI